MYIKIYTYLSVHRYLEKKHLYIKLSQQVHNASIGV